MMHVAVQRWLQSGTVCAGDVVWNLSMLFVQNNGIWTEYERNMGNLKFPSNTSEFPHCQNLHRTQLNDPNSHIVSIVKRIHTQIQCILQSRADKHVIYFCRLKAVNNIWRLHSSFHWFFFMEITMTIVDGAKYKKRFTISVIGWILFESRGNILAQFCVFCTPKNPHQHLVLLWLCKILLINCHIDQYWHRKHSLSQWHI